MTANDNEYDYLDHKSNILIGEKELQERIKEIALNISLDYRDKNLVLIGILKGATMFMMDLCRYIIVPLVYDFITVTSHSGTNSTQTVKVTKNITEKLENKHVIIVDDVYDTGITLNHVCLNLLSYKPASIKVCVLLNKRSQKIAQIKLNYKGFDIKDEFVVGYGLDYDDKFRNLPYICSIKK